MNKYENNLNINKYENNLNINSPSLFPILPAVKVKAGRSFP